MLVQYGGNVLITIDGERNECDCLRRPDSEGIHNQVQILTPASK
jgi:hypothetical protein